VVRLEISAISILSCALVQKSDIKILSFLIDSKNKMSRMFYNILEGIESPS
jgi:hypothetical protein